MRSSAADAVMASAPTKISVDAVAAARAEDTKTDSVGATVGDAEDGISVGAGVGVVMGASVGMRKPGTIMSKFQSSVAHSSQSFSAYPGHVSPS